LPVRNSLLQTPPCGSKSLSIPKRKNNNKNFVWY
jgi:hypothetical protein